MASQEMLATWASGNSTAPRPSSGGHHRGVRCRSRTAASSLAGLSARENEVLDLMAQGLSNRAISEQLHLSIKTVEPIVSSTFTKLALPADATTNRRVLAVRAHWGE